MSVRRCPRCVAGQLFYEPAPGGSLARTVAGWLVCLHCGEQTEVPKPTPKRRSISFRPATTGRKPNRRVAP